jgi:hypothetical protein
MPTSLQDVIPQLRDAIGPVILISGVGLLLLSFTNRLGRAIDRARLLDAELAKRDESERGPVRAQIAVLFRRAKMIRLSIICGALSVLMVAMLITVLFVGALLQWPYAWLVCVLFIGCMLSLMASLAAFIWDINLSLHALKLELEGDQGPKAGSAS